jgi:tetratricopeptide (TPR) repeat protein
VAELERVPAASGGPTLAKLKADFYAALGHLLSGLGNRDEDAAQAFRQSLAIHEKQLTQDPASADSQQRLTWSYAALARHLRRTGRALEASQLDAKQVALIKIVMEANPEAAWAYRARGSAYVELGQWQDAAAYYDKLLELRPAFQDVWFENAYLRLKRGDKKGYRELCRRMLEQFGQSKDVNEFAILAHTWVLAPQTPDDATRAVQLAEQRMSLTRANPIHGLWSVHVLSLAYYRNDLNDKAVECVAKGPKDRANVEYNLLNALVLAMAHYRLKHKDEAQKWLEQARQAIDQENRKREKDGAFAPPGWHWRGWLAVQMLRQEAEELLGTKTKKK